MEKTLIRSQFNDCRSIYRIYFNIEYQDENWDDQTQTINIFASETEFDKTFLEALTFIQFYLNQTYYNKEFFNLLLDAYTENQLEETFTWLSNFNQKQYHELKIDDTIYVQYYDEKGVLYYVNVDGTDYYLDNLREFYDSLDMPLEQKPKMLPSYIEAYLIESGLKPINHEKPNKKIKI